MPKPYWSWEIEERARKAIARLARKVLAQKKSMNKPVKITANSMGPNPSKIPLPSKRLLASSSNSKIKKGNTKGRFTFLN